ncbi:MAG: glycosyltransferase family 4 protein [Pseudoclavibacter sp.]
MQRVVLMLSEWLTENGYQVSLVSADGPLRDQISREVRWSQKDTKFKILSEVVQLFRIVRAERPIALHAHQRHDALVCHIVGKLTSTPVVEHAHNTLPNLGIKTLSFRSARIFAVSGEVKRMITDVYNRPAAVVTVVGGVPFHTSSEPTTELSPEPETPFRVLGIGRLEEQKDPERFVRVVAAARKLVELEAVWLGTGSHLEQARELAERLESPVTFLGESNEVVTELDRSDALLMTSKWEGLGLVVLEAFARKRPVIGPRTGGMGELLDEGRGVAVEPQETDESFGAQLAAMLKDRERSRALADKAYTYTQEHATEDAVFGPVLAEYTSYRRGTA